MKKFKFAAVITAAALIINSLSISAFAADSSDGNALYKEKISFLAAIGAIDSEWEGLEITKTVSRSDAAQILADVVCTEFAMPSPSGAVCDDVTARAGYAKAVYTVVTYGIMPLEDGKFNPSEHFTYADMRYALSAMLGYVNYAKATGMGAAALDKLVSKAGFTENVNYRANDPMTKAEFAVMLSDGLHCDMIYQTDYSPNKIAFDRNTEVTMMEEYMFVVEYEGTVDANKYTSLSSVTGLGSDEIELDGMRFYTGETNAADFVGTAADVYVKEGKNGKKGTVLSIGYADKVKTLTLNADEINTDSPSFSLSNIVYDDGNKTRSATVSKTADYFCNGRMCALTKADFNIDAGTVTLISNSGGSTYDTVKIDAYQNYVVDYYDSSTGTVYSKLKDANGNPMSICVDEDKMNDAYIELTRANGRVFKPSVLKENDVLSVNASKDKGYIRAVLSGNTIDGEITAIDENGPRVKVAIDGVEYELFRLGTGWGSEEFPYPYMGAQGEFYIDSYGYIAYAHYYPSSMMYGFLTGAYVESGVSGRARVQIVGEDGVIYELDIPDKGIKVNNYDGTAVKTKPEAVIAMLGEQQLVQFTANDDRKLVKLNVAQKIGEDPDAVLGSYDTGKFTLDYEFGATTNATYNSTIKSFYKGSSGDVKGSPDSSTIVFMLDDSGAGRVGAGDVAVVSIGTVKDRMKFTDIKYYDLDESLAAAAMTARVPQMTNMSDLAAQTNLFIFDKLMRFTDDKGDVKRKISLYVNGSLREYTVSDDCVFPEMKKGDILAIYTDWHGNVAKVANMKTQLANSNGISAWINSSYNAYQSYAYFGKTYLCGFGDERIAFINNPSSPAVDTLALVSPNVYEVSNESRDTSVTMGSLSTVHASVNPGEDSLIYYFANQGRVYDVVIYR